MKIYKCEYKINENTNIKLLQITASGPTGPSTHKHIITDFKLTEVVIRKQFLFPFPRLLNGTVISGTQFFGSNISLELQISLKHMELSNPREKWFELVHLQLHYSALQILSLHCKFLQCSKCVLCTAKGIKDVQQGQIQNSEFKIQIKLIWRFIVFKINYLVLIFHKQTFGHIQSVKCPFKTQRF